MHLLHFIYFVSKERWVTDGNFYRDKWNHFISHFFSIPAMLDNHSKVYPLFKNHFFMSRNIYFLLADGETYSYEFPTLVMKFHRFQKMKTLPFLLFSGFPSFDIFTVQFIFIKSISYNLFWHMKLPFLIKPIPPLFYTQIFFIHLEISDKYL